MIGSLNFQQMQAAGASSGGVSFGLGQQQYFPSEEQSIFAVNGESSSVSGISGIEAGTAGGEISTAAKSGEDTGLVARLDRMDASTVKPQEQNEFRANRLDLYA